MGQISNIQNPWRKVLLSEPASFAGIMFHVESGSRSSGRRTAVHEYPKRDQPYAEDMGRHAYRFSFSGYLIYKPPHSLPPMPYAPPIVGVRYDYVNQRKLLCAALDKEDAAMLRHPVFYPGGILVMCERYTMTETRERGGYSQFDMQFVEAGAPGNPETRPNTQSNVENTANNTDTTGKNLIDEIYPPKTEVMA